MKLRPVLLALSAAAVLIGCSKKPEVSTYKLVYPSKADQQPPAGAIPAGATLPEGHPPMGGASGMPPMAGTPGMAMPPGMTMPPADTSNNDLAWTIPDAWKAKPASSMRLASYSVPGGAAGADADFSIVRLGGEAGGVVGNINRWRGQVQLDPESDAEVEKAIKNVPTKLGTDAKVVQLDGKESGILAAMISYEGSTVFVKLMGAPQVLTANREAFEQVVASIATAKPAADK